jgi:thymidylate synthase
MPTPDETYNELVKRVLDDGEWEEGRNGKTKSVFGHMMRFDLRNGSLPLLRGKKVAWKTCLKELLWFIRGSTDNRELKNENVHIWDANATREFLDSRGLTNRTVDDLGPVYGHQWRHFNADYVDFDTSYEGTGVDQLNYIVEQLSNPKTRSSRRILLSAWNPCQIDQMALPPCHVLCQFNVSGENADQLSCMLYQRSGDIGLGVPFNIASYSMLTHIIAKRTGLKAKEFVHIIGNAHIYDDHIEPLSEQIKREIPAEADENGNYVVKYPTFTVKEFKEKLEDYKIEDFSMEGYEPLEVIKMKMRA